MGGLRSALRTFQKSPFITGVAILSLALGIGANAAIFSMFDEMLLRRLPVERPDELVNLAAPGPKPGSQSCGQAGGCDVVFSYPMFRDLQEAGGPFTGLAAHVLFGANLATANETMNGRGVMVSGSYFPVLGVQPALGRLLGPEDDRTIGAHYVVVLSHRYWENRLGRDPGILNQTLTVNGQPMTVVGVAQAGFDGTTLGASPDVFVPMTMREALIPGWTGLERRNSYWAYVFGRLKPGVTQEQADAEINSVYQAIVQEVEAPLQTSMSDQTMERFLAKRVLLEEGMKGQSSFQGEARTPLYLLFAVTGVVLLIACANIANLLLARGAARTQEMAIRGSLGAGRGQLLGQLLTESVVLAFLGGAASLLVAQWTLDLLTAAFPPEVTQAFAMKISPKVMLFTAAMSLGTGVLFGLFPALHSTRHDLVSMLKSSSGQPSGSKAAARFRGVLITGQVALSMALLVSAGLFIQSLRNVSQVDLGLRPDNVVTFRVAPELNGYEPERSLELFARMEEELAAIPGVTGVSSAMVPVLSGSNWGTDVAVEGFEWGPDIDVNSRYNVVGPAFFNTLGMALLSGREFTLADGEGAPEVAVVNEAFTHKFNLDGANAVGKYMSTDSRADELDIQIVGVVRDAKYAEVKQEVPPLFFTPYRQEDGIGFQTFYVRTGIDPSSVLRAIPTMVRRLDPNLPVEELKTLERQIEENVFVDRIISTMSGAFALLATLLAAVGLYGVLAYSVAQRTREIGLRMALGAGADRVRGMVLKQVGRITVIGGVMGIVAALFIGRAAESMLFGMDGSDPWVVGIVAVLLAAVAFGAGYVPAARASKVDPMVALRYE